MSRQVPLTLMARRLAPFVRDGLLDFSEALDLLMAMAVGRGQCDSWSRATAVEEWIGKILARDAGP